MDDITTQFEECLRRHLRSAKPNPINYDVELVQLARGIIDDSEVQMVRDLLTTDTLKWGELLEQALRHKMFPMLAHQIMSASLRFDVPTNIYMHLESALEWNRWQIEVFRRET